MISKVPTSSKILWFYENKLMKIKPKKDLIAKSLPSDSSLKTWGLKEGYFKAK